MKRLTCSVAPVLLLWTALAQPVEPAVRIATFDVDATPPLGSAMAYDPVKRLDDLTLRCRGIVLTGAGQPIVLCAVDWIGIANQGHEAFRAELAEAAGTVPARVALHAVHQHDAPGCDFRACPQSGVLSEWVLSPGSGDGMCDQSDRKSCGDGLKRLSGAASGDTSSAMSSSQ